MDATEIGWGWIGLDWLSIHNNHNIIIWIQFEFHNLNIWKQQ
jgi:hypothetical protein